MNIILSNDDGIECYGLKKLAEFLSKKHNVLVVAPDGNRSATSHSLSIGKPLKILKREDFPYLAYSVSGTPADCAKIAQLMFKDFNADLVISGINTEHNIGSDTFYSGTVAIAYESSYYGKISIAFSAFNAREEFMSKYIEYADKIITKLYSISKSGHVWNVNFPDCAKSDIKGVKITPLGKHLYSDRYEKIDENTYALRGELLFNKENPEDCDVNWIQKGYITISPMIFNRTDYNRIDFNLDNL